MLSAYNCPADFILVSGLSGIENISDSVTVLNQPSLGEFLNGLYYKIPNEEFDAKTSFAIFDSESSFGSEYIVYTYIKPDFDNNRVAVFYRYRYPIEGEEYDFFELMTFVDATPELWWVGGEQEFIIVGYGDIDYESEVVCLDNVVGNVGSSFFPGNANRTYTVESVFYTTPSPSPTPSFENPGFVDNQDIATRDQKYATPIELGSKRFRRLVALGYV